MTKAKLIKEMTKDVKERIEKTHKFLGDRDLTLKSAQALGVACVEEGIKLENKRVIDVLESKEELESSEGDHCTCLGNMIESLKADEGNVSDNE